jgi:hypothetical protein
LNEFLWLPLFDIFLSMCDVKVSLTFTRLSLVLFWQLFCLFCSSIVINTVIVTETVSQMKMTSQEIRIITTGPCIANQLWDVNTICRRSWYITAHIWKIYDFKIDLLTEFGTALTTILLILFQYCYKYCYSDSRNLWAVMKAGGLAL